MILIIYTVPVGPKLSEGQANKMTTIALNRPIFCNKINKGDDVLFYLMKCKSFQSVLVYLPL